MPRCFVRTLALSAALLAAAAPARSGELVQLVGYLDVSPLINYTDVWGWMHPVTGRAYALVGNNASGMHIVDVTDPANPVEAAVVSTVPRYDMKTFGQLVYSVDGLANGAGGITDITDPENPVVVGSFPGGHNIWIDNQGFLYVALPGLTMYNLTPDPIHPQFVWEIESPDGHDSFVRDDVLYDFRGYAGTFIYDVTNRYAPQLLGSITDPSIAFHHEGRLSTNGRYLFLCDEFAVSPAPDITVWDLANVANPVKVGAIYDPTATAHYCYVVGNYLAVAYFTAGFRLYDITNPTYPDLVDQFDTSPKTGEGIFEGAYGCFPFGPGATVYVNDRPNGLYVFRFDFPTGVERTPAGVSLVANRPNPFGASTTVAYRVERATEVSLTVHDVAGRRVRVLDAGSVAAGEHVATWDGRDETGREVASGVYFCRLRASGQEIVRKMVLVR
jgi:hypothetical protein